MLPKQPAPSCPSGLSQDALLRALLLPMLTKTPGQLSPMASAPAPTCPSVLRGCVGCGSAFSSVAP